jgi:uncharacterized membrane protein
VVSTTSDLGIQQSAFGNRFFQCTLILLPPHELRDAIRALPAADWLSRPALCKAADAPPSSIPAAEPPPPALLGIWTVVSHSMPGVSAMSDAEADKWHGLSIRLLQAEAVSRSDRCVTPEYRSVADTLELSCGQGVWSAFGARMFAAGPDRVRALWDGVLFELERDQDLTAVGQEPGWFLELTQGKELRLIYAYGEKRVIIPAPPGTRDSSGAVTYRAKADSTDLAILVTRANCADAMSGKPYPMTVTVTVNGETLRGCGEPMKVIDGIPIAKAALATLRIPGFADFLALDGDGAWVTNEGRVERLVASESKPVATVPMGSPCGAMAVDFGSLWVADCKERVVVRIGLTSHNVEAKVATGTGRSDRRAEHRDRSGVGMDPLRHQWQARPDRSRHQYRNRDHPRRRRFIRGGIWIRLGLDHHD